MNKSLQNQVIALAGTAQAVYLVQQLARKGRTYPDDFLTSVESVLKLDADTPEAIFGDIQYLRTGLLVLMELLGADPGIDRRPARPVDRELARYFGNMIFHGQAVTRKEERIRKIRTGVERAYRQAEQLNSIHPHVIATLAETYQEAISPYKPRVMILGEPYYLSNEENSRIIRALLLAAARSSALWWHCGGSHFRLLFGRKDFQREARTLLDSLT
jgi:high frequency lysogenization protein